MATTGETHPGNGSAGIGLGVWHWTSPGNITSTNGVSATANVCTSGSTNTKDYELYLIDASSSSTGNNKADTGTNWPALLTDKTYGSSTDRWGAPLTHTMVNSSNFGVFLTVKAAASADPTDQLRAKSFGFSIPTNAYINGVICTIKRSYTYTSRTLTTTANVDSIRLEVYYTKQFYPKIRFFGWLCALATPLLTLIGVLKVECQSREIHRVTPSVT